MGNINKWGFRKQKKNEPLPTVFGVEHIRNSGKLYYKIRLRHENGTTTSCLLQPGVPIPKVGDKFDVARDGMYK